jgi:flavin reductase (DIM6/NTAB) family NADH-FMN oxidoreductase RutF
MKNVLNKKDISELEQRYRANFINSIEGFKALNLVGTINKEGITNLAPFNSIFHVGANPPLVGMVSRPDSVDRHTLENIKSSGQFTLNHVNESIYKLAHQTSARYAAHVSEFYAVGLIPQYISGFAAPFVKESNIKIGLELREIMPIELNGTIIVIGEIVQIELENNLIADDGFVDIQQHGSITVAGLDAYYTTSLLERLPYAKS